MGSPFWRGIEWRLRINDLRGANPDPDVSIGLQRGSSIVRQSAHVGAPQKALIMIAANAQRKNLHTRLSDRNDPTTIRDTP
jgi:hypothetical protein